MSCSSTREPWSRCLTAARAAITSSPSFSQPGRSACLDFFLAGGAQLVPTSLEALERCRALIAQYSDLPMDFADSTLVVLAEDLRTDLVLTTDQLDFQIYRIAGKQPFRILPLQA